ncbi:MAG: hypothetical protein RIR26_1194 [Pseudomonadota bacterium]|jgi:hypothetical protein
MTPLKFKGFLKQMAGTVVAATDLLRHLKQGALGRTQP